ncbi:imidazole glycerol phosphate synthase subunit HisH [Pontibacter sp. G13]|uniref:imidazole glycerol phosphate synthase subunit HisH n=1 Tax=Pontibacter sp. G13 TaxID=3074898 RepID=UPI00288A80E8|nr:imidazole glycerol phosphate synthase subunit HisH [Pontibacter sp. G13]WNJ18726.1 imidazole glycerol phosphate synthase subunit HisH [Pontibacter sp. G13]
MNLAIIKYNAGNIQSVTYALERLGITPILTDDPEEIRRADKVIFPGVGEASTAMRYVREANLQHLIPDLKQPVLGICLGMQIMCRHSEENDTDCLGIFDLEVKRFPEGEQKVPHMGWNKLTDLKTPLMQGLPADAFVYFVHSYYAELDDACIAQSDYVLPFAAALHKDNFYATQFHPEKSGKVGAKILQNFIELI